MTRRARPSTATSAAAVAAVVAVLVLAACGSAHHTKPPANPGGPNIPATSSGPTSVNPGGPDIPASSSTSLTTPTSTAPASTSTATSSTTTASHPASRGGAHLDARFHLGAGGAVTPAQVMLPSGVPIVLEISNGATHSYTVSLDGGSHPGSVVAAGGTATDHLSRLAKGSYRLLVDGHTAAHLVIGVAPGP